VIELSLIHLQLTYKHLQIVVDTSIFLVQCLYEVCGRSWVLWSEIWKLKDQEWQKLKIKHDFPVSSILIMYYYYTTTTTTTTTLLLLLQYNTLLSTSCIVQCAKQPYGSVSCGFYVCEYPRTCSRYSSSWRKLKKAEGWWEKETIDPQFRQTVADICKFVTEAAHEGQTFFNKEGT